MNLQFVRQAIYQQKTSGVATEQPLATTEQETWVPGALISSPEKGGFPDNHTTVTAESQTRSLYSFVDDDEIDVVPTALVATGGVEFRISPLVDSRESRLEERKALEEFHGLQSEARVVIVPETKITERKQSPPPKRARVKIVKAPRVEIPSNAKQSQSPASKSPPVLLAAYESGSDD